MLGTSLRHEIGVSLSNRFWTGLKRRTSAGLSEADDGQFSARWAGGGYPETHDLGGQRGDNGGGAGLLDAVVPVPTSSAGQVASQAMLSRVSQRWLLRSAGGLQQDFVLQDMTAITVTA
jgi:hypothetical protein